ncbi:hypothetical protein SCATT_p13380 (plasmid) [Streptantibioticus cattleyicolor NRRL 8057 = DSM 46488]|uniref:Uncharacterized protein n=1 Tax=Streptantibioticus cattleyicolor (strain ATCC 35852 / DSM 46488 / JCM 4925 / NBRC 14057 / NRRL 8057) TaxID=1003195 RepID=G8XFS0_STREN|nr:hypothetical protein SCATT_p13380 [Streptantibioticus cattleyicolor NRRL 8057 = DSM 46488]
MIVQAVRRYGGDHVVAAGGVGGYTEFGAACVGLWPETF